MTKARHDLHELMCTCRFKLAELGVRIHFTDDIRVFSQAVEGAGKLPPHPMMSAEFFDFKENDFGSVVLEYRNAIAGGIGCYYYDLGKRTLGQHMTQSYQRLYGEHGNVGQMAPLVRDRITGPTVYLGEMFLTKPPRGTRGVSALVLIYIQALSFLFFDPNWVHAFVRVEDGTRSKPLEYGFTTAIPAVQLWENPPKRQFSTEYFVANDRSQFSHFAATCLKQPHVLDLLLAPGSSER